MTGRIRSGTLKNWLARNGNNLAALAALATFASVPVRCLDYVSALAVKCDHGAFLPNSHCLEVSLLYAIRKSNEQFAIGAPGFLNAGRLLEDNPLSATRTLKFSSHANTSCSVGGSDDPPDDQNKHNDSAHDGRQDNPCNGFLSVLVTRDAKQPASGEREVMFRANYRLTARATLAAGWA